MSLFEQLKIAITDVKKYGLLLGLKTRKFVLYFLLLVLINVLGVCVSVVPFYVKSGGVQAFAEYIPDFTIENGKLSTEFYEFTSDEQSTCVYIDTSKSDLELAKGRGYQTVVIASDTQIYMYNGVEEQTFSVAEIEQTFGAINKADAVAFISSKSFEAALIIGFFISVILAFIFSLFINGIIDACIINFCNAISIKADVGFWKIYKISVYALTLPTILNIVFTLLGLSMFQWIVNILAFVYVYYALKEIKKGDGMVIAVLDQ